MDKIAKLFRKISGHDRERLLLLAERLRNKDLKGLDIKKLRGTDFYRLRSGNFRILFHLASQREVIIDSIKLRNENTYRAV